MTIRSRSAFLLNLGSISAMSSAPVMIKVAVETLPPLLAAGLSASVVAVASTVYHRVRNGSGPLIRLMSHRGLLWFALVSAAASFLLYQGIAWTDPVTGGLLIQLSVPFGVLLAVIRLRERFTTPGLASLGTVLAGLLLFLLAQSGGDAGSGHWYGLLTVSMAALAFAYGSVLAKPLSARYGAACLVAGSSAVSATVLLVLSAIRYDLGAVLVTTPPTVYAALLVAALVGSLVGKLLFYRAIRAGSVSSASAVRSLGPVLVAAYSLPFGLASLTAGQAAGGLVLVLGLMCLARFPVQSSTGSAQLRQPATAAA